VTSCQVLSCEWRSSADSDEVGHLFQFSSDSHSDFCRTPIPISVGQFTERSDALEDLYLGVRRSQGFAAAVLRFRSPAEGRRFERPPPARPRRVFGRAVSGGNGFRTPVRVSAGRHRVTDSSARPNRRAEDGRTSRLRIRRTVFGSTTLTSLPHL